DDVRIGGVPFAPFRQRVEGGHDQELVFFARPPPGRLPGLWLDWRRPGRRTPRPGVRNDLRLDHGRQGAERVEVLLRRALPPRPALGSAVEEVIQLLHGRAESRAVGLDPGGRLLEHYRVVQYPARGGHPLEPGPATPRDVIGDRLAELLKRGKQVAHDAFP